MNGPRVPTTLLATLAMAAGLGLASVVFARGLGPEDFGRYAFLIAVSGLMVLVGSLGTGAALRILSVRDHAQSLKITYLAFSALVAVLAGLLMAGFALASGFGWTVSAGAGALAFSMTLGRQGLDGLHAKGETHLGVTVAAAGAFAMAAAGWLLSAVGALTVLLAALLMAAASIVPFVVFLVRGGAMPRRVPSWSDARRDSILLIRTGVPALGLTVGLAVLMRVDRVILGSVSGAEAVGVYAVAAAVAEFARMVPASVGQVAYFRAPVVDRSQLGRLRVVGVLACGGVAVLIIVVAPTLIPLLFGQPFSDAVPLARVLALAEVALALSLIDGRILLGRGNARVVGLVGIVGAVLGSAFFWVLIGRYDALGAAVASLLAYAALSLLMAVGYRRQVGRPAEEVR